MLAPVKTLYIRNVPDEVADYLTKLAALHGVSVNTIALRELGRLARRSRNAEILDTLPSIPVNVDELVADIHAARGEP